MKEGKTEILFFNKVDWTIEYTEIDIGSGQKIKLKKDDTNRVISKRIKSYFTKEPKTLEWINSFDNNSTLVDVGANIGVYSIYAGAKGHNVISYEPHAQNFSELILNIYLNNLGSKIKAYPFALMDKDSIGDLSVLSIVPGQSHNNYNMDDTSFSHGVFSCRLDTLKLPSVDHIKVDVDGLEEKVLTGMLNTIKQSKSILIEVTDKKQLEPILDLGFKINTDMTYKLSKKETNYVCVNSSW